MNINEIRKSALAELIAECGGADKLAERADVSAKYIKQILSGYQGPKDRNPRNVGNELARKLEEACKKPSGWMDTHHAQEGANAVNSPGYPEAQMQYLLRAAATKQAGAMQAAIRAMANELGINAADLVDDSAGARERIATALMRPSGGKAPAQRQYINLDAAQVTHSTEEKK